MKKICGICKKEFETTRANKNICSWSCRQENNRTFSRERARENRATKRLCVKITYYKKRKCFICGFDETVDTHHEGTSTYTLCPNHHALITRNIKTIKQLKERKLPSEIIYLA